MPKTFVKAMVTSSSNSTSRWFSILPFLRFSFHLLTSPINLTGFIFFLFFFSDFSVFFLLSLHNNNNRQSQLLSSLKVSICSKLVNFPKVFGKMSINKSIQIMSLSQTVTCRATFLPPLPSKSGQKICFPKRCGIF